MPLRIVVFMAAMLLIASVKGVHAQPPAPPPLVASPIGLHIGGEFRRLSRDICALKAMEVMALKEKFVVAEIDQDGNAWGCNETNLVRVFTIPYQDGVHVIIVTAGDNKEAERLRTAIRAHVFDGEVNPKTPRQHRSNDSKRKPCDLVLRWSWEQRNLVPTVRHFVPAAAIVMEKHGMASSPAGSALIFGGNPKAAVAAMVLPGPNEVNVQIGSIAVSAQENEAERLHNVVRAGVAKVLFD